MFWLGSLLSRKFGFKFQKVKDQAKPDCFQVDFTIALYGSHFVISFRVGADLFVVSKIESAPKVAKTDLEREGGKDAD